MTGETPFPLAGEGWGGGAIGVHENAKDAAESHGNREVVPLA